MPPKIPVEDRGPNARSLHFALVDSGVSGAALARRLRVTPALVSHYRSGRVPMSEANLTRFLAAIEAEKAGLPQ